MYMIKAIYIKLITKFVNQFLHHVMMGGCREGDEEGGGLLPHFLRTEQSLPDSRLSVFLDFPAKTSHSPFITCKYSH